MQTHSRNTSDIIRYDFLKFSRRDAVRKVSTDTSKVEDKVPNALEEYRAELVNDDGRSSYGAYKCPIF